MPFTNKDKKYIKDTVGGAVDELARIVSKGFEGVDKRLETADKRLSHLEMEAMHTNARLSVMERDIGEIKKYFVYRDEFADLMARVAYLEKRSGIKSGK